MIVTLVAVTDRTVGGLEQRFSKCGARPTGRAQRFDRWVANGRDEREIIIIFIQFF